MQSGSRGQLSLVRFLLFHYDSFGVPDSQTEGGRWQGLTQTKTVASVLFEKAKIHAMQKTSYWRVQKESALG